MKKLIKLFGIAVLVSVIGFTMLACASTPPEPEEPMIPDASSAIIYFLQPTMLNRSGNIIIWDGENPVGRIGGGLYRNVAYRASPGTHYFMGNRFNWSHVRVDVRANNVYYIKLNWAPNPIPRANAFIILEVMSQEDGLAEFKKNERIITFSDEWREQFKKGLSERYLAQVQENLNAARN